MYDELEILWKRLGVDDVEIDAFVEANRGTTEEAVAAVSLIHPKISLPPNWRTREKLDTLILILFHIYPFTVRRRSEAHD
jgi:hypothetical protein